MFSKILIKLIDHSIVPAILLLSVRIISVILVAEYYGFEFEVTSSGFKFTSMIDYVLVNTYSMFFMLLALCLGLFYVLIKSFVFHDSHISPSLTAKMFSLKAHSFIQGSFDIYSQGVIWLSYLYLLSLASAGLVAFGFLQKWILYFGVGFSILATVLFVLDIEHEIQIARENKDILTAEDYMLHYGDEYV